MAEFAKICQNNNGIKRKPITNINLQSNAIIKRIHQNIGNIICTFDVFNTVISNPWSGILAETMFDIHATSQTTLQELPMQLVFVRDAILNIKHVSDWEHIQQYKQEQFNRNNKRKHMRSNNH